MTEPSPPIKIAYMIDSLRSGGAERQLTELVTRLDRRRFSPRVFVWKSEDFYDRALEAKGVPVYRHVRRGKLDFSPVTVPARWLRTGEVDVIHAYLERANLYAVLAAMLARRGTVVASERNSERHLPGVMKWYKPWSHRRAPLTVANSEQGRRFVLKISGLSPDRVVTIPNGLDMDRFGVVTASEKAEMRRMLGWPLDRPVLLSVGTIAMPSKNYVGLARALAKTGAAESCAICWIGDQKGHHLENCMDDVHAALRDAGLDGKVRMLDPIKNIEQAYQASDMLLHAAHYEGTPNVVLEALACERPVLATDVGDTARYVQNGKTGWLVPPGDPAALEAALGEALHAGPATWRELGRAGRERLKARGMDVDTLVRRHERLYEYMVRGGDTRPDFAEATAAEDVAWQS